MGLKKVSFKNSDWDMYYLEGEVTEKDVHIERTMEKTSRTEYEYSGVTNYVTSKVEVILDPAIVEVLDMKCVYHEETPGLRRIVQHDSVKSDDPRKIKAMMTRHRKECESRFSEERIQEQVDWLVESCNRDIARMKAKFKDKAAQIMRSIDGWTFDSQDEIDRIQREIDELEARISAKHAAKNEIINKEMNEWLTGELEDDEFRKEIMEQAGFRGDIPSRKKRHLRRH